MYIDLFINSDIGSNIGSYTLPVASMKRKVVAVDMMEDNLGYIKTSLIKSNLTQYVELVHNAVRLLILIVFILFEYSF